jgi:hypothetical protein
MNPPLLGEVVRRDGHLSHLAVEGYVLDMLDASARAEVEAHLTTCAACRARVEALRADEAAARAPETPVPANNRRWAGLALAAAVLLAVIPVLSSEPQVRTKGSFDLRVMADEGDVSRALGLVDKVRPGQRIGFQVAARDEGFLAIVGVDDTGAAYACYPPGGEMVSFASGDRAIDLPRAVRVDAASRYEHIVGLHCDTPYAMKDVKARLETVAAEGVADILASDLFSDCRQREVHLRKATP